MFCCHYVFVIAVFISFVEVLLKIQEKFFLFEISMKNFESLIR